jgi:very-short-patch-repair endonuclease
MTRAEVALWNALRGKQLGGLKFRRQHVMGPYIVDFYCVAVRLAVELDGEAHGEETARHHDAQRDHWIARQGVRILRIPNRLVLDDIDEALRLIGQSARLETRFGSSL